MNRYISTSIAILALLASVLPGCIKNDIPYPHIQANIRSLTVKDQLQAPTIDSTNLTVNVVLKETADIYAADITEYTLTPGASVVDDKLIGKTDLSKPLQVTLRLYQDYKWVIITRQEIERYFTVSGQMGSSVIDVPARRVVVTLPESVNLRQVKVLTCKLGAEGSSMTPELAGTTIDLRRPFKVTVTNHGRSDEWEIYADVTKSTVTTVRADAWTQVAWVYGEAEEGKDNGIEYRRADDSQWTRVPAEWLTVNGGSFHARIIHLQPETEYAARAYSGDEYGNEVVFTTGADVQVPNSDFNQWWLNGKIWNPWQEDGIQYWDTGNKGATTLGPSNTVPTEDTPTGKGLAAMLETKFVGIGVIGKLAAGNIFVGYYVRTDGTNGVLSLGREFTQRPTRLRGYMKYKCAPISSVTAGFEHMRNEPDTCIIWSALIDSDEPFEIRTNPNNRSLFDPEAPSVIAYGNIQSGKTIEEYIPFEFIFDYKDTERTPNYILIVASASKYGDYFTGGNGSVLYIDDLELLYDY